MKDSWTTSKGRLNINMAYYKFRDYHYKDKTVSHRSYLYNDNPIHGNTVFILRRDSAVPSHSLRAVIVIACLAVGVLGLFGEHPGIWLGLAGMLISEIPRAWFRASATSIHGLILLCLNLQNSGSVLSSLVLSSSNSGVWKLPFFSCTTWTQRDHPLPIAVWSRVVPWYPGRRYCQRPCKFPNI